MGRGEVAPVMSFLFSSLIGALCGILSAFGIGGGSLLMVWLTAALDVEQRTAQGINLLYFLPTALAAIILHTKHRFVDWKTAAYAIPAGCVMAALFSWFSAQMDLAILQKLFGGFLLIIGILEFRKGRKK